MGGPWGWGLFGFGVPGVREVVLVALVALALYGRAGSQILLSTRHAKVLPWWVRLIRPSTAHARRRAAAAEPPTKPGVLPRGRLFWALALAFAAAVAAWVATSLVIRGSGPPG